MYYRKSDFVTLGDHPASAKKTMTKIINLNSLFILPKTNVVLSNLSMGVGNKYKISAQ